MNYFSLLIFASFEILVVNEKICCPLKEESMGKTVISVLVCIRRKATAS